MPRRLVLVRDYIAKNHNTTIDDDNFHQAELMFECDVKDFSTMGCGVEPDSDSQQILWVDLDDLEGSDFMPQAIVPYLKKLADIKETIVLGDVN